MRSYMYAHGLNFLARPCRTRTALIAEYIIKYRIISERVINDTDDVVSMASDRKNNTSIRLMGAQQQP